METCPFVAKMLVKAGGGASVARAEVVTRSQAAAKTVAETDFN